MPRTLRVLLLVALIFRVAAAVTTLVINHDGARYTMAARAIEAGDWDAALNVEPRMPPLYPLAIAGVSHLTGSLGRAGVLVSVLCGTLLVIPIFFLARAMFGDRIAWISGLIVAILPDLVLLSGDIWTEPLFLLCFFSSIAALWFAAERASWGLYALAGFFGGLAVNTRPEGLYTAAALAGWGAIAAWIHRGDRRAARIAGPLLGLAVWIVLALPYSAWIKSRFGFWSPTTNQFAATLLGRPNIEKTYTEGYRVDEARAFESGRDQAAMGRVFGQAWYVLKTYVRSSGYVFLALLLVGCFVARGRGAAYLTIIAVGYAIPTWLGLFFYLPFDDRFAIPSWVALAPIMAAGASGLYDRLPGAWNRRRVATIALALLVVGCAVKPFKPHDQRRRTLADAGRWIKERYGAGRPILTMDRRVEHYAEAWSERVPPTWEETLKLFASKNPVAVVMYDPYVAQLEPGFEEKLAARCEKVYTVPKGDRGHEVRIYEVR